MTTSSNLIQFEAVGSKTILTMEQFIPRPVAEVFAFFAAEKNLERLTPPFLRFRVLGKSTPAIQKGTVIDYTLRLHGIPFHWKTLIAEWKLNERFIDEQRKGPYRRWEHTHEFVSHNGGTQMRDRVIYQLPLGVLGRAVAGKWVRRDIEKIFQYRYDTITEVFPPR